jgi:hypothetical protein
MLRNTGNLAPASLRETHPDLTKGDIRAYILSHLQFSVSVQAVLLGISPASVTKARQRLKAKMQARELSVAMNQEIEIIESSKKIHK